MSHARTQIRQAVAAAVTGLPTSQERVYPSRAHPIGKGQDPSLLVYTDDETVVEDASQGRPVNYLRELTVSIEARAEDNLPDRLDETLDKMAAEVEAALGSGAGEQPLGGLVLDLQLVAVGPTRDGAGEVVKGAQRLDYLASYRTAENDPQTILD